jgi:hypothetical protein
MVYRLSLHFAITLCQDIQHLTRIHISQWGCRFVDVDLDCESCVGLVRLCNSSESFVGTPYKGLSRGPASSRRRKDRTTKTTSHHVPTRDAWVLLTMRFQIRCVLVGSFDPNVKWSTRQ